MITAFTITTNTLSIITTTILSIITTVPFANLRKTSLLGTDSPALQRQIAQGELCVGVMLEFVCEGQLFLFGLHSYTCSVLSSCSASTNLRIVIH